MKLWAMRTHENGCDDTNDCLYVGHTPLQCLDQWNDDYGMSFDPSLDEDESMQWQDEWVEIRKKIEESLAQPYSNNWAQAETERWFVHLETVEVPVKQ